MKTSPEFEETDIGRELAQAINRSDKVIKIDLDGLGCLLVYLLAYCILLLAAIESQPETCGPFSDEDSLFDGFGDLK